MIDKKDAIKEANRWMTERNYTKCEVVDYNPQGDGLSWSMNCEEDEHLSFLEIKKELEEYLTAWAREKTNP